MIYINITSFVLIETRRLKNVVIFFCTKVIAFNELTEIYICYSSEESFGASCSIQTTMLIMFDILLKNECASFLTSCRMTSNLES